MRRNRKTLLVCLLILSFIALGCDGTSHLHGHVYDNDGKPISGAVVWFDTIGYEKNSSANTETRADGSFNAFLMHAPFSTKLHLKVAQTGYKIFESDFYSDDLHKWEEKDQEFRVVLQREQ